MNKQRYFDDVDILTNRPEGMPYDEYKARMKAQKKVIKQYLKGEMIHLSKLYPHSIIMDNFKLKHNATPEEIIKTAIATGNQKMMLLIKGLTYEKTRDDV